MQFYNRHKSGFTLIEIIIVAAVLMLFFGGIMLSIQYSIQLISFSRVKISALSVATDRLELVRSLPYNSIGVISGFPAGPIPQVETIVFNGFTFTVRTLIDYVDDSADGLATADGNGITTDYKQVEISVEWTLRGVTDQVVFKSTASPRSIETNVGGGTVRVNVFDAAVAPVSAATVRVFNTSGITYDVTRFTDASGSALFSVASGSNYQIEVSRPGFSRDGTLVPTTAVPNPATSPITVLEAGISTMNFFIDRTSTATIVLADSVVSASTVVDLTTPTNWATSTAVRVVTGTELDEVAGVYVSNGSFMVNPYTPTSLARWEYALLAADVPTNTEVRYRFYTSTNTADLIPDSDLPGNSTGFTTRVVNLRGLDATLYPTLVVGVELSTTDGTETPEVTSLTFVSVESSVPAANQSFTLQGQKAIGTNAMAVPVPKTLVATTTDTSGVRTLTNLEWDTFELVLPPGLTVREVCPAFPLQLAPDTTVTVSAILQATSTNSLLVTVVDAAGATVPAATVDLVYGGSVVASDTTSGCGQVYFSGLTSQPDYVLELSHPDLGPLVIDPVLVSGVTSAPVSY